VEKLNNDKFQKLKEFKIDNLDLVRGGYWTARTREVGSAAWSDGIQVSYSMSDGSWVSTPTSLKDYGHLLPL